MKIDVYIFFAGLIMWSAQVPNDSGVVRAIIPSVQYSSPLSTFARPVSEHRSHNGIELVSQSRRSDAMQLPRDVKHVENHRAAIFFPVESYRSQVGWARVENLPNPTGGPVEFQYVVLDGDHLYFDTRGAQNPPSSVASMQLPSLQNVCLSKMQTLRNDFLPPYRAAAAVFDIPAGTLSSCQTSGTRVDTKLELQTNAFLVISAATIKTTKELSLKPGKDGKITFAIVNLPERYFRNDFNPPAATAMDGMEHSQSYYAMGAGTGSCPSLQQWFLQNQSTIGYVPPCTTEYMAGKAPGTKAAPPVVYKIGALSTAASNFECSNSLWP